MIDVDDWSLEEVKIFEIFNFRCAKCGRNADCLHEIIPKSNNPKNWKRSENRIPLCAMCHEQIHARGAKNFVDELNRLRKRFNNS